MKKRLILCVVVLVLASLVLVGCTTTANKNYNEQILKFSSEKSNFEYTGENEDVKTDWTLSAGNDKAVSSVFSTSSNGLKINTQNAGYAVASQKVYLKPDSYYKVTYSYKIDSIGEFSDTDDTSRWVGLYAGFLENSSFNIGDDKKSEIRETTKVYKTETFYFHTDNTKEYNFAFFVGLEDYPASAVVYIQDATLERVTEAEASESGSPYGIYELKSAVYGQPTKLNIVYIVLGGVATLVLAYVFYVLRSRSLAFEGVKTENSFYEKLVSSKWLGLVIVLGVSGLLRVAITLIQTIIAGSKGISSTYFGYELEQNAYMAMFVAKHGTTYLYQYVESFTTLMPLTMYLLSFAGIIGRALEAMGLNASAATLSVVCIIKLINIAADLGTIALIYKLIAKKQGNVSATILAGFYSVIPVAFSLSSAWGSFESVSVFLIVLAFWFLLERKSYLGMAIAYFGACMTTVSAIYVCPAVLMYTAYIIYKAIKDREYKRLIAPACVIVGSVIVFYLISLPFVYNEVAGGDFFACVTRYFETLKHGQVYTANAFNFQAMLGNNFKSITVQSIIVTVIYIAFVVGVLAVAYFRSRNRIDLTLIAVVCVIAFWTFGNNMDHNALYVALPLMFIVATLLKETRLYIAFTAYSALAFVNSAYIYLVAGYTTDGIVAVSNSSTAVMYVFGALALVAVIYFVIVAYDVMINRKAVEHTVINVPYFKYVEITARKIGAKLKVGASKTGAFITATGEAIKEVNEERKLKRAARKNAESEDSEE